MIFKFEPYSGVRFLFSKLIICIYIFIYLVQLDWSQYHARADTQLDTQHILPSLYSPLLSHYPFNVTKIIKQKRR